MLDHHAQFESLESRQLLATFMVTNADDSGAGSLRDAILFANGESGADVIEFDDSLGGQSIDLTTGEIPITDSLTINGLANGQRVQISGSDQSRIFFISAAAVLNSLSLHSGNGSGSGFNGCGGAIYNDSGADLTLVNSIVEGNTAPGSGGGIYNYDASVILTIENSTIRSNTAVSAGGGIFNDQGDVELSNSAISSNTATDGGGIYNSANGLVTLEQSMIDSNEATGVGGGIVNDGFLTLSNSTLSNNTAGTYGGAIYSPNSGNTSDLANAGVIGNTAGVSGGGIYSEQGATVALSDSTVSGNVATTGDGGGIYNPRDGTVALLNSTVSGNIAGTSGGGLWNGGPDDLDPDVHLGPAMMTLSNSTVAANSATSFGGGIYNFPIPSCTVMLTSTIVADNTGGASLDEIFGSIYPGSTNNLIQDSATAGGLLDAIDGNVVGVDALLGPLASNGGPTQTHALLVGSPAIGMGINTLGLTADQRGGPFVRGTTVDIGSYQRQSLALVVDTLADVVDGDYSTENLSLREAIEASNANPGADSISFAPALNGGTIGLDGTELRVSDDLSIEGPGADLLTISGSMLSRVFNFASGESTVAAITVSYGSVTAPSPDDGNPSNGSGGGILNEGTLTLIDMMISGNAATRSGGGVLNYYGTLVVTNSVITSNTSSHGGGIFASGTVTITASTISENSAGAGGGIGIVACQLTVAGSTISGNTASAGRGGGISSLNEGSFDLMIAVSDSDISGNSASDDGGGIFSINKPLSLTNTVVSNNTSGHYGGGIFNGGFGAVLTLSGSTVSDNIATDGCGGGIFVDTDNSALVTNSTISDNATQSLTGGSDGGGGLFNRGTVSITGSTISGNSTQNAGGGFHNAGSMTLTNTTISGNSAVNVAGGGFNSGTLTIHNSTVYQNEGGVFGGGGVYAEVGGTTKLVSTIVAGNAQGDVIGTLSSGSTNNLIQDAARSGGLTDGVDGNLVGFDPQLAPLAYNGGPTKTHSPLAGSPAIDQGINPLNLTTDQRGFERFGGFAIDIGAFETRVFSKISVGIPSGVADSSNDHRVVSLNPNGHIIFFIHSWTVEDLQERTGAPNATGDAVIWVDPKDGLTYVAAPTGEGLILFARSLAGTWSFRNLTTETGATGSPAGNLTQFTTVVDRIVIIAGITADGNIVAFQQTLSAAPGGGPAFKFVDISADLAAQSQTTPQFTTGMISYVPKWDTWNLAGIDSLGNIQSVWINPRKFTRWRTDNLSVITGAAALAGQLTVTLTPWSAINLTGLNSSGQVVTTWWIPRFKGKWANNNLTQEYSGSTLAGGNITGFVTPWGSVNYVGISDSGDVTVYWWTPALKWVVSLLVPSTTPESNIPTGALTSSASAAGTLNVYGNNADGELLRISWPRPVGKGWNIENLTTNAVQR